MQIGGASSYSASAVNLLPARPLMSSASLYVPRDITRAAQAPINSAPPWLAKQLASASAGPSAPIRQVARKLGRVCQHYFVLICIGRRRLQCWPRLSIC
jgi:hypothetical protein